MGSMRRFIGGRYLIHMQGSVQNLSVPRNHFDHMRIAMITSAAFNIVIKIKDVHRRVFQSKN